MSLISEEEKERRRSTYKEINDVKEIGEDFLASGVHSYAHLSVIDVEKKMNNAKDNLRIQTIKKKEVKQIEEPEELPIEETEELSPDFFNMILDSLDHKKSPEELNEHNND